mgnify:CR=1 FL=1
MSDFTHPFWSLFVTISSVLGILGCLWLLFVAGTAKVKNTGDNTTGHVWDEDLREMNNPLPRWWMWLFIITCVFSFAYLIAYPGFGSFPGKLNWSQEGEYRTETANAKRDLEPIYARFTALPPEKMAGDAQAMAVGERLYMNNCAQCHGSDARGSKSFPNLTDGEWLWDGAPENIKETITNGRNGVMTPFGQVLGADGVKDVANYVRSMNGLAHDSVRAQRGKDAFANNCVACHGADAKGNPMLGAPDLTNNVWLYGSSEATIIETITHGRNNKMPAFGEFLGEDKVHILSAYVLSLSKK